MNNRIRVCFVASLILFTAQSSHGQTPELDRAAFGTYGDVAFINHTADFRAIPGFPNCCPQFTSGTGLAPDFGVYYKFPLAADLKFYVRAGYAGYGATLTDREQTTVLDQSGDPTPGAFDHTIVASLASVGIEPMLGYTLFGNFMLRAGGRVGYVVTKTFSQKEVIAEPSTFGIFTDTHTRTRNQFDGQTIPNAAAIEGAFLAGVSYSFPLNSSGTLHVVPEAYYSFGLTEITKSLTWKANAIRAGLGIEFTPPIPGPPPLIVVVPPITPKKQILAASVIAVGVTPDGKEYPHVKINVEEFLSTRLRPLLNYVFFADSSSIIPDRYSRLTPEQTQNFRVEKLYNYETLPTYYHLLNIVGRRLVENPTANIKLVGCNSDERKELGNTALSRDRAEHVREYLHEVWNISNERMQIEARNLPEKPSFITDSDGIVENRRVEIQSDDWNIVQPVLTSDTITNLAPHALRFEPSVQADAGVKFWEIDVDRDGAPIKQFSGSGSVPSNIDWQIDGNDQTSLFTRDARSIQYSLTVKDNIGQEITTLPDSIAVEKMTIEKKRSDRIQDKQVNHYSLILFDFDQATLTVANQKIVEHVREHTSPDATVHITGYTDRMGDDAHNQQLAEARARQVALALNMKAESITGLGKSVLLYDNNLPEGRFYCRTVNIDVESPVKE